MIISIDNIPPISNYFYKEALSDGDSLRGRGKIQTDEDDDIFHQNPSICSNIYLWDSDLAAKKEASIPSGQVSVQCCDFETNTRDSSYISFDERFRVLD